MFLLLPFAATAAAATKASAHPHCLTPQGLCYCPDAGTDTKVVVAEYTTQDAIFGSRFTPQEVDLPVPATETDPQKLQVSRVYM